MQFDPVMERWGGEPAAGGGSGNGRYGSRQAKRLAAGMDPPPFTW